LVLGLAPNQGEVWTSTAPQRGAIVRLLVVTAMLAYAILQWCVHDVVASGELMLCPELCKSADRTIPFCGQDPLYARLGQFTISVHSPF
jgi:hypothetical protein